MKPQYIGLAALMKHQATHLCQRAPWTIPTNVQNLTFSPVVKPTQDALKNILIPNSVKFGRLGQFSSRILIKDVDVSFENLTT